MAERKKRGLGRGLGALIPDANSNERPVDVFFSGGETEREGEQTQKSSRTARNDPAASMQSSRRRKTKAGSGPKTANTEESTGTAGTGAGTKSGGATKTSTGNAKTSGSKSAKASSASAKAGTSKSGSAKTAKAESTSAKSGASKTAASKSGTSQPVGANSGATKSSGKPAGTQAASSKASGTKSSPSSTREGNSSTSSKASAKAGSAKAPSRGSSPSKPSELVESPVEPESAAQTAPSADDGIKGDREARPGSEASSATVADVLEDVRETHPGVFTSSGHDKTDEAATGSSEDDSGVDTDGTARKKTTDVVSSDGGRSSETAPAAEGAVAATPVDSVPGVGESGKDDQVGDIGEADDGSASDSTDSDQAYDGVESIPDTEFGEIEVDLIDANPRQPRTVFDEDLLAELVHSIREIGVLQPVVVRQKPSDRSRFELIMGERRLRATKDAGLSTIPAIIRYVEDTDLLRDALLENLHRAELNPLEEAAAYGQLLEDFGCTQEELSERIGRSRPQISNTLRLLRLPPLVQRRVAAGVISAGHARAILGLRDPEHMEVLAQRIVAEGLSVRASEEAVVLLNRGDSINVSRATSKVAPEFLAVAERLGDRLDTKVNISVGKKKGKLSVEFANQEDLDRILGLLGISESANE